MVIGSALPLWRPRPGDGNRVHLPPSEEIMPSMRTLPGVGGAELLWPVARDAP